MGNLLSHLVIFMLLLDMAVSVDPQDLWRVRREHALVARAALAALVLVPLFALCLTFIDAIPCQTQVSLALLAAAPGAPLVARRAAALGSDLARSMALQLTVANLGVLTAPIAVTAIAWVHGVNLHLSPLPLAAQLFTVQVIPLLLGAILCFKVPGFTQRMSKPVSRIANLVMLVMIGVVVVMKGPLLAHVDRASWLALLAFSAFALGVGHALGGPDDDTRKALAICCANRNLGMAVLMGTMVSTKVGQTQLGLEGEHAAPLIMVFALVNFIVSSAYGAKWAYHLRGRSEGSVARPVRPAAH